MARGRQVVVRGQRAPRRSTLWIDIGAGSSTQTAAGGVITNSLNAGALLLRPFTIVRTHMEMYFFSDQVIASESISAAIGGAVVSDQASAIGVTAVPTPVTDAGSDLFFFHRWMFGRFTFVTGTGVDGNGGESFSVDSKAMRKVNEDQDLLIILELSTAGGGGWTMITGGRILVKLH